MTVGEVERLASAIEAIARTIDTSTGNIVDAVHDASQYNTIKESDDEPQALDIINVAVPKGGCCTIHIRSRTWYGPLS